MGRLGVAVFLDIVALEDGEDAMISVLLSKTLVGPGTAMTLVRDTIELLV